MNAPGPADAGPGPSDTSISSEPGKRSPAVSGRRSTDSASTSAGGADAVVVAGTCDISGDQELSRATTSLCASLMKQFARATNVLAFAGTFGPEEQVDVLRATSVRRDLPLPPTLPAARPRAWRLRQARAGRSEASDTYTPKPPHITDQPATCARHAGSRAVAPTKGSANRRAARVSCAGRSRPCPASPAAGSGWRSRSR
jgi:hypothetical protein